MACGLDEKGVCCSERQEGGRKGEVEIGKLERNEGVHGLGFYILGMRGLKSCLNFDQVSLDVKRTTHHRSDMENKGGFGKVS